MGGVFVTGYRIADFEVVEVQLPYLVSSGSDDQRETVTVSVSLLFQCAVGLLLRLETLNFTVSQPIDFH